MISIMRQQVGFAAAIAHARLRLSRIELLGHAGRVAGRSAAVTALFLSQTIWERHSRGALGGGGGRAGAMGAGLFFLRSSRSLVGASCVCRESW